MQPNNGGSRPGHVHLISARLCMRVHIMTDEIFINHVKARVCIGVRVISSACECGGLWCCLRGCISF